MQAITDDDVNVREMRLIREQLDPAWQARFAESLANRIEDLHRWAAWFEVTEPAAWFVSVHEISHVAAAFEAGAFISSVSVVPGTESLGRLRSYRLGDDPEGRMLTLLAGPVGESMIVRTAFWLPIWYDTDGEQIRSLLMENEPEFTLRAGFARSKMFKRIEQSTREFVLARWNLILLGACLLTEFAALGPAAIGMVMRSRI